MGYLLEPRYVWASKLYIWKEKDIVSKRQRGKSTVQDDSKMAATNILEKEYIFEERGRTNVWL